MAQEYAAIICQELSLRPRQVTSTIRLLKEGCTIPFIARYRKEATGSLDEVMIHNVQQRYQSLMELEERKATVLDTIGSQGKLTDELRKRIEETLDPAVLEDIYLPYRPKRKTRATVARERGLEPLAKMIMSQNSDAFLTKAKQFTGGEVDSAEAAIAGATDIIAEWVSESEKARGIVRSRYLRSAVITSRVVKGKEEEGQNYRNYFDFSEPLRTSSPHRYLAMRRGESEGFLKIDISIDDDEMIERLSRMFVRSTATPEATRIVKAAVKDGYRRLMRPSIENEIASSVKEKSDDAAISLFAENVRQLLMAPPLSRKRVLAIDPGFASGCKVVCLDEHGTLLEHAVVYPTPPHNDFYGAADLLCFLVNKHYIDIIAVGNGTGGRDTERFLQSVQFPRKVTVVTVSEQGASVYSASDLAREEFPNEDVTVRGAVSIGRRLIDPLAELVKIEPKSIGVGQYQHDVNQNKLKTALDYTVESCVNSVGVNVNTASRALLAYVSGIGQQLAANIVAYRDQIKGFSCREQLMEVPRMGEKTFQQCAGFLRIPGGTNPLDNTAVHPERYELVERIASDMGVTVERMIKDTNLLHLIDLEKYSTRQVGLPTLNDIVSELEKPGRDPRETVEEEPVYIEGLKSIHDLHLDMILTGKVNNITAFGAFVDLGLKENGLIHISQLSNGFISSPSEVVRVGQTVKVRVMDIDVARGRIALTMKDVPQN